MILRQLFRAIIDMISLYKNVMRLNGFLLFNLGLKGYQDATLEYYHSLLVK